MINRFQAIAHLIFGRSGVFVKQEATLDSKNESHLNVLRFALLDFISDFANWDNSTVRAYLEASNALTKAAHEATGGNKNTEPFVADPFAGGGAIPLESIRVGAKPFASDINPIPVLLNKIACEYAPKFKTSLASEVLKQGHRIHAEATKIINTYYPIDSDNSKPIAYLWARTIICEGPGCGAAIPLLRSMWLAKKDKRSIALKLIVKNKKIDFDIVEKKGNQWVMSSDLNISVDTPLFEGTIRNGSAVCPCCNFTTANANVRKQLSLRAGGTMDARLIAVVCTRQSEKGRFYRLPNESDYGALEKALCEYNRNEDDFPHEKIAPERPSPNARGLSAVTRIGINEFRHLFTPRQNITISTYLGLARNVADFIDNSQEDFKVAVQSCLTLIIGKLLQYNSSLCRWKVSGESLVDTFARQALPVVWDFAEASPIGCASGDFVGQLEWHVEALKHIAAIPTNITGDIVQSSATRHPLPDDSIELLFSDPPYYDAIPYADLSDFFYVWLKKSLRDIHPDLFSTNLTPKDEEAIWNPGRIYSVTGKPKDKEFYESQMTKALKEARRYVKPNGIGVIVFAHKSTAGWEAILSALLEAGWIATASWPIDTEMQNRVNAMGTASLASSIHLVCRPRENPDGSVSENDIGDWRDVLQELPKRIHDWMPRLAHEGVVGADAIFACLGPALEIFSRYSHVEKASGEVVTLKEYLEHIWAVVAKEALDMVFAGAQTSDFEEDARLTAMWLWTLSAGAEESAKQESVEEESSDEEEISSPKKTAGGFSLEFDTARKIAQGLGAHLEQLQNLLETKGDTARLLPVSERARYLFGKEAVEAPKKKKKKSAQISLFAELGIEEDGSAGLDLHASGKIGETVLDRLHQSMILFAAGRSEALKRFLVEDGVGQDQRFWRLAQAFSALYPSVSEEKRWVDGVLARKKGLGF